MLSTTGLGSVSSLGCLDAPSVLPTRLLAIYNLNKTKNIPPVSLGGPRLKNYLLLRPHIFFLPCCRSKSAAQQVTAVASAQVAEQEAAVAAAAVPDWVYDPNEPRYCLCNQVSQMTADLFIPNLPRRRNITPAWLAQALKKSLKKHHVLEKSSNIEKLWDILDNSLKAP